MQVYRQSLRWQTAHGVIAIICVSFQLITNRATMHIEVTLWNHTKASGKVTSSPQELRPGLHLRGLHKKCMQLPWAVHSYLLASSSCRKLRVGKCLCRREGTGYSGVSWSRTLDQRKFPVTVIWSFGFLLTSGFDKEHADFVSQKMLLVECKCPSKENLSMRLYCTSYGGPA